MKKVYLATTSFFPYLNNKIDETKLVENLVVTFLNAGFFWRTPQKYEVDIILEEEGEVIPLEVKYTKNADEVKNLLRFCGKFNARKAIMATKDKLSEKEFKLKNGKKIKIKFIPVWMLLLRLD